MLVHVQDTSGVQFTMKCNNNHTFTQMISQGLMNHKHIIIPTTNVVLYVH